jgi:hypothetical protein
MRPELDYCRRCEKAFLDDMKGGTDGLSKYDGEWLCADCISEAETAKEKISIEVDAILAYFSVERWAA